jgi:chromosome partitioning protein
MSVLPTFEFDDKILAQGAEISRKLDQLRVEKFPTTGQKTLRRFTMAEVAHYLGVSPNKPETPSPRE